MPHIFGLRPERRPFFHAAVGFHADSVCKGAAVNDSSPVWLEMTAISCLKKPKNEKLVAVKEKKKSINISMSLSWNRYLEMLVLLPVSLFGLIFYFFSFN